MKGNLTLTYWFFLIAGLFVFRLLYGLCAMFWFSDQLQIYLIGLKSYTTFTWPYYGPDVVYTQTQIPGALQGLLVSLPFYIAKVPEAPIVFLNILSFASLSLLAVYIKKQMPRISTWLIWVMVMVTPWTLFFSTNVVNPSYVLVFSIPFCVAYVEAFKRTTSPFMPLSICFLVMGVCTTCIMQLHLSWILLVVMSVVLFLHYGMKCISMQWKYYAFYAVGFLIGALTLLPTLFNVDIYGGEIDSNAVFSPSNWQNLPAIFARLLSFASYEVPYILDGEGMGEKVSLIYESQSWVLPFLFILLLAGFAQVFLFFWKLIFTKPANESFLFMRWFVIFAGLFLYVSFFFSVKGPSSHTFYLLLPFIFLYAFQCYDWLAQKWKYTFPLLKILAVCSIFFHAGLALYNLPKKSLYINRPKVEKALDQMDYRILGERRSDKWGYGY